MSVSEIKEIDSGRYNGLVPRDAALLAFCELTNMPKEAAFSEFNKISDIQVVTNRYCIVRIDQEFDKSVSSEKRYGEYLYVENGEAHQIKSFDKNTKQITSSTNRIIQLVDEPSYDFLQELWDDDEDFVVSTPYYYATIGDFINTKPSMHDS